MSVVHRLIVVTMVIAGAWIPIAEAQPQPVGRCDDHSRKLSIVFLSNGTFVVPGPGMTGAVALDPTGMTALLVQAAVPWQQAFFVSHGGELVEINPNGWFPLGPCTFAQGWMPQRVQPTYTPPTYSPQYGVEGPAGFAPLPEVLVGDTQMERPFARPLLATSDQAQRCWEQSDDGNDREAFGHCMVRGMVGDRERAAYDCVRGAEDNAAAGICLVAALGGDKERKVAEALSLCRDKYQDDYRLYPLCVASQKGVLDDKLGKALACVQQQGHSGKIDLIGAAVCYGAGTLDLNPEMQIIVQCAATTGGEPYAFASCAGGQLTVRELDKCFTGGIGKEKGCFGPNNDIVKALGNAGQLLEKQFGPGNDLVNAWNTAYHDLTKGPGPNNEVRKAFKNIGDEVGRTFGPNNDLRKAIEKVVPRIKIKAKIKIKW